MQYFWEDAAILAGLSLSSIALFSILWICLGPLGVAGTIAGYFVGLLIYLVP